MFVIGFER